MPACHACALLALIAGPCISLHLKISQRMHTGILHRQIEDTTSTCTACHACAPLALIAGPCISLHLKIPQRMHTKYLDHPVEHTTVFALLDVVDVLIACWVVLTSKVDCSFCLAIDALVGE